MHGNESALKVFASPRVHVLPQHEKTGLTFSSPNVVDEILPQRDSSSNNRINAQSTDHPIFGTDDALALSEGQTFNNDSEFRTERGKQKVSFTSFPLCFDDLNSFQDLDKLFKLLHVCSVMKLELQGKLKLMRCGCGKSLRD